MNPNPTGYAAMQQHPNPMLAAAGAYPAQTGSPSSQQQQFAYYGNPMASYAQPRPQQQQHSFNAMPMQAQTTGPMAMNMSAPHANINLPYSSSPSPFPPTTTTAPSPSQAQSPSTVPTTSLQQSPQNMAAFSNPAMMTAQQRSAVQAPTQSPKGQGQQGQPQSSAAAQRERARISALLTINSSLLQEVVNLQAAGKAGANPAQSSPTQGQSTGSPGADPTANANDPSKKPSQEYVDCMRRLQVNLAYLATIADRSKKPGAAVPTAPILTAPPNMPKLNEMYTKLNELFPEAGRNASVPQPRPSQSGQVAENAV
ncbi:hypothetical protein BGW36DRAFT_433407 [Talaromyces proteolyticus]|uniref:Uncharacterized protein n=1 Tax=Talaromyces proteolyticus TaxID=1131652 RepID=A0AAD4KDA7_9EURO|nr:uncharacterized protein BGW36DRAFT_433407 [Talaromyces proteolyticus]KAH8689406.1 hypothetical protein BGW36DRAFT_433407 [Talaromyces proteolyticus]